MAIASAALAPSTPNKMLQRHALYLTRHMIRRYKVTTRGTRWDGRGKYVAQWLVPPASKDMDRAAERVMDKRWTKYQPPEIVTVQVSKIRSGQGMLTHAQLCRAIKNYSLWQRRNTRLPSLVYWRGLYFIWDGNHRVTAALLLGKTMIRARVYYAKKKPRR